MYEIKLGNTLMLNVGTVTQLLYPLGFPVLYMKPKLLCWFSKFEKVFSTFVQLGVKFELKINIVSIFSISSEVKIVCTKLIRTLNRIIK